MIIPVRVSAFFLKYQQRDRHKYTIVDSIDKTLVKKCEKNEN